MIVPAVGAIPDLLNAGIHTLRGNYTDAAMSVFFAIPIVGDAAAAGNKLKKGADKVGDVLHSVDNAVDSAKAAENVANAGKNAAKNADNTLDVTKIAPKVDINRLHHIFGKPEHALESLVSKYGSPENAYRAVQEAANQALKDGRLTPNASGLLPTGDLGIIIDVGGIKVRLIGGRVVGGQVILSSFSRRGL